jgi:hypothetical protein
MTESFVSTIDIRGHPGAYQGFDLEGVDEFGLQRYRWLYNPGAAADAIIQVREFLSKHMK